MIWILVSAGAPSCCHHISCLLLCWWRKFLWTTLYFIMCRYPLVFKEPSTKWRPNTVPVQAKSIYTIIWSSLCSNSIKWCKHLLILLVLTSKFALTITSSYLTRCWRKFPFRLSRVCIFQNCLLIKTYRWKLMSLTILRREQRKKSKTIMLRWTFPFSSHDCLTLIKFISVHTALFLYIFSDCY